MKLEERMNYNELLTTSVNIRILRDMENGKFYREVGFFDRLNTLVWIGASIYLLGVVGYMGFLILVDIITTVF